MYLGRKNQKLTFDFHYINKYKKIDSHLFQFFPMRKVDPQIH